MKARWAFFEEWAGYGAAFVEDVNSPMPESHQRRCAWRQCLTQRQQAVQRETPFYVNGGFVGLSRVHRGFLYAWRRAMTLVGEEIGGLERSMFSFEAANRAGIPSAELSVQQDRPGCAQHRGHDRARACLDHGQRRHGFPAGRLDDVARARHGKTVATKIHPRRLRWAAAVVRGPRILAIRRRRRTGPLGRAPCAGSRWQSALPSDVSIAGPEDFWTIS